MPASCERSLSCFRAKFILKPDIEHTKKGTKCLFLATKEVNGLCTSAGKSRKNWKELELQLSANKSGTDRIQYLRWSSVQVSNLQAWGWRDDGHANNLL